MPNAQGRITIRRRPKNGEDGSDAVNFRFIPSASSIVLQKDGTLRPSALSARLVKNEGGQDTDIITQSFDGYTVKSQIKKSDGNINSGYTPGTNLNLTNYASTLLSVVFELYRDSKVVASLSVPCIPSGIDGEDAYLLDLDNEMQGIPCNSSGTPTGTGTLASTNSTVYKGSKVDTGWTFTKTDTNCTSSIDANGKVSVTAISADKASVKVTATKGTMTREAVMSLYKVKPGSNGSSPVVYSIEVSASAISRDKSGALNPTSITAYKVKTVGNSSARTTEMTLKYQREGQDATESALTGQGGEIKDISADCTAVIITLYSGTVVLDKERIPIVKDGDDGKPGEDAYILDLDNEVEGIPCNSSGTPTGTGTLASTNSTVYKGSKVDTGWTFTKTDTNCTSSIDANGKVSVTAISADKASVKVTATKGTMTREAVMSLYKVKPGSNGSSPVVYSIEVSASAISRDKSGTLNPTSITAYKNKTVGSTTSRTAEKTIKYKREGQDSTETTLTGNGGTINSISAACTGVLITIYDTDGTTILDRERVPIVKDGTDGDDGADGVSYSVILTPDSITVKANGSVICNGDGINAKAYKNVGGVINVANDGAMKLVYTKMDGTKSEISATGITAEGASSYSAVSFEYRVNNVTVASKALVINREGLEGKQGIQGCIYRRSKHVIGFGYHNDSALTTDGIRYIDLVYIMKDSTMYASHALWFRCKKTHTSNANNAPQTTNTGNEAWLEYWEPMNTLEPLYTPFLLADDAVITLMQSNQILIANDEGVITAGMSGSLAGSKIRIWAGSQTPDSAPFRVDVVGKMFSSDAEITGKITATSGKIAGFNISGNSLTNGPDFTNDACIIFRNDTHNTFAGIGGNVLPATTGMRAVARFENDDTNNFWGLGRNIAMLLSAKNADINHAFLGTGNGNLDGWIGGYHYSKYTLNTANTIYHGYLNIAQNNKWIIYAIGKNTGITLPTLSEVRNALGIGNSTAFCVEFTIVADVLTQNSFKLYGRTQTKVTVNGSEQTPYFTGEYPTVVNQNGARVDSWEMASGDSITFLLIYDPNKTGTLDTSYTLMYSARIINYQQ